MRSGRLGMSRLGMDWFRPRDRLETLLAAIAEGSGIVRTIAANKRAIRARTDDWRRRAGKMKGSRGAVPCPAGGRWRARVGGGSGRVDN